MDFTPQRPRRARPDPPSREVLKSKSRHRVSPYADSDETACIKPNTKVVDVKANATTSSLGDNEASSVSQPASNNSDGAKSRHNEDCVDHMGHGEAASEVDQGTQEAAPLLVTKVDEDGQVEFEYNGAIYRVVDVSAFEKAMGEAPKPPKRTLSSLRRAQCMSRTARSNDAERDADTTAEIAIDATSAYSTTSTVRDNALSAAVRAAGGVCADIPRQLPLAGPFAFGPSVADELRGDH